MILHKRNQTPQRQKTEGIEKASCKFNISVTYFQEKTHRRNLAKLCTTFSLPHAHFFMAVLKLCQFTGNPAPQS
jgi:hypothetical protein